MGGDSGAAAEPGEVEGSLLLQALRYEAFEMPPSGQLPDDIVADFVSWIERGLPDPRTGVTGKPHEIDIEVGRQHWAYQPLAAPKIPMVDGSSAETPIDAFVLSRLTQEQLHQGPQADGATRVRRLYFDLLGLPPTPAEVDAFVRNDSPVTYENLVDQLLASPRFGERWGRHWLDVVRYADSITLRGFLLPEAWRYRDYVIDAFNQDQPLDQFIKEQVAGDLLPANSLEDQRRQLVATGFLTLGNSNLEDQDKQKLRMDVVDEQLETIGRAFLAQTIGCARCHDHKFDPIPTRDYYALAGILRNTKTLEHANVSQWLEVPLPLTAEEEDAVRRHELAVAELESQIEALKQRGSTSSSAESTVDDSADESARELTSLEDKQRLEVKLERLKQSGLQRPMVMSVQEESEMGDTPIRIRGDVHNLGPVAPRGFLQVASHDPPASFSNSQSGRVELGDWLCARTIR